MLDPVSGRSVAKTLTGSPKRYFIIPSIPESKFFSLFVKHQSGFRKE